MPNELIDSRLDLIDPAIRILLLLVGQFRCVAACYIAGLQVVLIIAGCIQTKIFAADEVR